MAHNGTVGGGSTPAILGSWKWDILSGTLIWSDEVYRVLGFDTESFQPTYQAFKISSTPMTWLSLKQRSTTVSRADGSMIANFVLSARTAMGELCMRADWRSLQKRVSRSA